jgi:hypothetical protein
VWSAAESALEETSISLQRDAFRLLERMLDPGGLHDAPTAELLARDAEGLVARDAAGIA